MTCTYKRKRITGIPDVAIRGLDDEHYAIEQAINCLQEGINDVGTVSDPVGTDLSVIDVTANNVTVASSTGSDAVIPAATDTTAGLATAAHITAIDSIAPTNLGVSNITASNLTVTSSTGADVVLPAATSALAGLVTGSQVTSIYASMRYVGVWAAGTYTKNAVARTGRWLARANQDTTQDPKPASNGRKNLIEAQRAWAFVTASARCGIQVKSVTSKIIVSGVRVNIPEAGYVSISIGINDVQYWVYRNYWVETGRWVDLYFAPFTVDAGTKLDIIMDSNSRKEFANSFSAGANVQGFIASSYPVQSYELNTTSYSVNAIYEDITSWPSAWDLLSGY